MLNVQNYLDIFLRTRGKKLLTQKYFNPEMGKIPATSVLSPKSWKFSLFFCSLPQIYTSLVYKIVLTQIFRATCGFQVAESPTHAMFWEENRILDPSTAISLAWGKEGGEKKQDLWPEY